MWSGHAERGKLPRLLLSRGPALDQFPNDAEFINFSGIHPKEPDNSRQRRDSDSEKDLFRTATSPICLRIDVHLAPGLMVKNRPLDFYKTQKKKQENSCQAHRFSEFGNNHGSLAEKGENLVNWK